jgi:hypothetical protein
VDDGCIAVAVSLEPSIVSVSATDLAARLIMAAARHSLQPLAPYVTDVGFGPYNGIVNDNFVLDIVAIRIIYRDF